MVNMVNKIILEGYVSKVNTFTYGGDRTGVHFDLENRVYHPKTEKEAAHLTKMVFHCVALGGTVKRLLAECKDGNPLLEVGIQMKVSGKLNVCKNKKGEITYENVSIIVIDFSVSSKRGSISFLL